MRQGKVALLVVGALAAVVGGAFALGGGALLLAHTTQRDAAGFYTTSNHHFFTPNYALTSKVDLGQRPGEHDWVPFQHLATVRVRAESVRGGAVFVGIGPRADVDRYLAGVAHDELVDVNLAPFQAHYRPAGGGGTPADPRAQTFWVARAEGPGAQSVTWRTEGGGWAVVLMNADAAPAVSVEASVGAKVGILLPIGIGLAAFGLLLFAGGILMVVLGARSDRTTPGMPPGAGNSGAMTPPATAAYPVRVDARLDLPLNRALWLVKWILVIPHVIVLAALWVAFLVSTVVAGFAVLFTSRYPRAIFDFNVGVLRWTWRVSYYCYGALGTDRYPPFSLQADPGYPADLSVEYPERLSRGLVLVKWWLLVLPQYLVVAILAGGWHFAGGSGLIGVLVLIAAVILLFTGRYPPEIFDLVVGLNRWTFRVIAYAALLRDEYPPFRLDQGGTDPGSVPAAPPPVPDRGGTLVGSSR